MVDKPVNGVIFGLSDEILIEFYFQKKIQNRILSPVEANFSYSIDSIQLADFHVEEILHQYPIKRLYDRIYFFTMDITPVLNNKRKRQRRSQLMNNKGTKYGVLSSYDTLFADDPWKMKIFEAI
jgi:hypothetical protein